MATADSRRAIPNQTSLNEASKAGQSIEAKNSTEDGRVRALGRPKFGLPAVGGYAVDDTMSSGFTISAK